MTTLIRIGNSQGIRIPKAVIEQARLEDKQLEFKVVDDGLLIQPVRRNREGWKEQFDKALQSRESDEVDVEWLAAPLLDEDDWEW
jgi:antitoxin MazE